MTRVLLVHPPVSKPGEPPAGIARLKAALESAGVHCALIDANLEGIQYLLAGDVPEQDAWTKNAAEGAGRNIREIRGGTAFKSIGHYNRIVNDLNRLISLRGSRTGYHLSLADCTHAALSAARSADLIHCAKTPGDDPFFEYYSGRLLPAIEAHAPGIIGLSVNFLSQAFCSFALAGLIRERFPGVKLVMGGGLITSWMRNPGWSDPFSGLIDHCVEGPGESFLLSIAGVADPGEKYATPDFGDLTESAYLSPGFVLPYNTSTGCFWRKCRFCPEQAEGGEYRAIPQDKVLSDLRELKRTLNPTLIHFLDNALSQSFLDRLAAGDPVGVPWYGYVRISERLADRDYCGRIRESGCVMLKLGLESGDQDVLDSMEKGIRIETASKALLSLKKAGIPVYVYLLFGTPAESEDAAARTMQFVLDHHEAIDYINAAIFNMPVSGEYARLFPTRLFSDGDLPLYADFDHPLAWDRPKIRHFLDRRFRRHPVISKILARTPKLFTSNHAPFFFMKKEG